MIASRTFCWLLLSFAITSSCFVNDQSSIVLGYNATSLVNTEGHNDYGYGLSIGISDKRDAQLAINISKLQTESAARDTIWRVAIGSSRLKQSVGPTPYFWDANFLLMFGEGDVFNVGYNLKYGVKATLGNVNAMLACGSSVYVNSEDDIQKIAADILLQAMIKVKF